MLHRSFTKAATRGHHLAFSCSLSLQCCLRCTAASLLGCSAPLPWWRGATSCTMHGAHPSGAWLPSKSHHMSECHRQSKPSLGHTADNESLLVWCNWALYAVVFQCTPAYHTRLQPETDACRTADTSQSLSCVNTNAKPGHAGQVRSAKGSAHVCPSTSCKNKLPTFELRDMYTSY